MDIEKRVLANVLRLYKNFPCLWDRSNVLYYDRELKSKAYKVLLEKFKVLQEDATLETLKRRLNRMRSAYRRLRRQMRAAKNNGENYNPSLWYFKDISFIDKYDSDGTSNANTDTETYEKKDTYVEYTHEECLDEDLGEIASPSGDKANNEESLLRKYLLEDNPKKLHSVYLRQHSNSRSEESLESLETIKNEEVRSNSDTDPEIIENNTVACLTSDESNKKQEALAFGTLIESKLKKLDSFQRNMAEKLISDTIFYAKCNKLTAGSAVQLM